MRNLLIGLLMVIGLIVQGACAPTVEGNPVAPPATGLSATPEGNPVVPSATGLSAALEVPARLPDGDSVMLQFTLTNNSDVDLYILKWYTPLEGIGGEIFRVERDGQAVPYAGILAMRGNPTPEGYILLAAGRSASAEVDLATSFDFSQPGEYTIEFLSPRISHIAGSEAEMATSVDQLGPVAIPSNSVRVKVGVPSGEQSETRPGGDLLRYQGASPFYPEALPFEIDYSPSVWQYVPGDEPNHVDRLEHRQITRCSLWLGGGGVGASPVSTASLAGHEWTISQLRHDFLQYATRWDDGALIFDLRLPKRYDSDVKGPCEPSAEDVLRTIRVTGQTLPHSMKGYELYSWFEEDEDHWYYTLITATNRLKTFEEIRARTNVVRPDGWVSIMVQGDGPLKTLLRRLPEGEHLTWVGVEWLKNARAGKEMIETIVLPDAATVAEIEALCRESDLRLNLTEAPVPKSKLKPPPVLARTLLLEGIGPDGEAAQLTVRETPIVTATVIGPGRFEYDVQLGDEILAHIEALRERSAEHSLAQTSAALAPLGYWLESRFDADWNRTFYDLYREGEAEPLLPGLSPLWPAFINASVNASGTDFVLVVENAPNTKPWKLLVYNDEVQEWDPVPSLHFPPAYVGDALARITATGDLTITYRVELDGRAVYTGTTVAMGAYMPLRSFTTWDDHWLLEVDDHLIMDGQDIGQALGYDAAFGFARIGGQSFYFFEQNGLVGISYDGHVLPNLYEQVFHNHCCEAAIHNVEAGPDAVWFHALRDGVWCWVEAGLDDGAGNR